VAVNVTEHTPAVVLQLLALRLAPAAGALKLKVLTLLVLRLPWAS
jgi:hypothetical protein